MRAEICEERLAFLTDCKSSEKKNNDESYCWTKQIIFRSPVMLAHPVEKRSHSVPAYLLVIVYCRHTEYVQERFL